MSAATDRSKHVRPMPPTPSARAGGSGPPGVAEAERRRLLGSLSESAGTVAAALLFQKESSGGVTYAHPKPDQHDQAGPKLCNLTDQAYRTLLRSVAGVESCKDLSNAGVEDVMAILEGQGFDSHPGGKTYWRDKVDRRGSAPTSGWST
jgi:hypothetical protein